MARRARKPAVQPIRLPNLRLFFHAFQSAELALVVIDLHGKVTHANPAAETLLGWKPRELIGLTVNQLLAPGQAPITLAQLEANGDRWIGVLEHRRKRGAVFPARISVSLVRDQVGDALASVAVLEDATPRQREQARLASLAAVGAALNAESDLPTLLARVCREARALFATDGAYLFRFDEPSQQLVGVIGDGPGTADLAQCRLPLAQPESAVVQAALTRRPAVRRFASVEAIPPEVQPYRTRCGLAVPLLRGERVLGVLVVSDNNDFERFGPDDGELLRAYAELVTVALEGATLHEAARAQRAQLLALSQLGQLVTGSLDLDSVLAAVADGALRLLEVDEIRIWRLAGPAGPARAVQCRGEGAPPCHDVDISDTKMLEVVLTGRPDQSNDLQHLSNGLERDHAVKFGLNSCLWIPLVVRGRVFGCLTLRTRAARTFSAEEIDLALTFGNQAAIAVHNAETVERERQVSRLEQLYRRTLSLEPSDRQMIGQVLRAAGRLVELRLANPGPPPRSGP
jgi:PAS domain S-box-containing protein